MTYDYHIVLGIVTLLMNLLGYGLYFRSIFKGITKPHPFTWLLFAVVDGTVFLAQTMSGGGPGAWVLGMATLLNTVVFLTALAWGEKRIMKIDWACLTAAFFGIVLWWITDDAFLAVVCAALADGIAKIPTIRKSYLRPDEESMSIWILDILKFSLSIAALTSLNPTTVLFPAEIILTNALVVIVVLLRRKRLAAEGKTG